VGAVASSSCEQGNKHSCVTQQCCYGYSQLVLHACCCCCLTARMCCAQTFAPCNEPLTRSGTWRSSLGFNSYCTAVEAAVPQQQQHQCWQQACARVKMVGAGARTQPYLMGARC
jgi:hypothetical protein